MITAGPHPTPLKVPTEGVQISQVGKFDTGSGGGLRGPFAYVLFLGWQEHPQGGRFGLYNVVAGRGLTADSTMSLRTLKGRGYRVRILRRHHLV